MYTDWPMLYDDLQAVLPDYLCPETNGKPSPSLAIDRYNSPEEKITNYAHLVSESWGVHFQNQVYFFVGVLFDASLRDI